MMRVVVVEDHALVRQSLVKTVSSEPGFEVVGDTGRADSGLEMIKRSKPDIVMLDISLPDDDGLSLAEKVKEALPETRIVFLTMHEYETSIRRAIEIGADAYVPKAATMEELLEALKSVASGDTYLSPSIAKRVMNLASSRRSSSSTSLTDRELQILELLADGARPTDVAEKLFLSVKTVKNHLTNIYMKLGVSSAAQAVSEAYHRKLVAPK